VTQLGPLWEPKIPEGSSQDSGGVLPISLARKSTLNLTRAKIVPLFGSPRTRDVSTLAIAFPRGELSPPPDSWWGRPVFPFSSRAAAVPPRFLPHRRRHHGAPPLVALHIRPVGPVLGALTAVPRPCWHRALHRGARGRGGALPAPVRRGLLLSC
jgi:hypothetical protein